MEHTDGFTIYKNQSESLIQSVLDKHPDKPYLEGFRNYIAALAPRTAYQYLVNVVGFVTYINKPITELTIDDYTAYMMRLQRQNLSQTCQINIYAALKKFSAYLFDRDYCKKFHMASVPRPKFYETTETVARRESGFLNKREINKCLKALEASADKMAMRNYFLFVLLLNTGIRCSAAYKLNLSDIVCDANGVYSFSVMEKKNKINCSYLNENVLDAFRKYMEWRSQFPELTKSEALFINRYGERLSQKGIREVITKDCEVLGRLVTPHKLRATFASILYDKTHDIYFVQKAMNHASTVTTDKYIRGKDDGMRTSVADIMNIATSRKKS